MTLLPDSGAPIYVAGHRGMVGSAIWRELEGQGFRNLIGWSSAEVDLRDPTASREAITAARPAVVVMAAARVGGIGANARHPVEFLNDNLLIQTNVFRAAHEAGVERLLFLGSSCIYPKFAPQPIPESALLTGPLEPTNQAYAMAKISGIIAVQSYRRQYDRRWISAMPTNLYGPGDNFDLASAHVLPALVRRFVEAQDSGAESVTVWGTGTPRREFLHTADLARACVHLLSHYDEEQHVNVGTGQDISIAELAQLVAQLTGYKGAVRWDTGRPDGTPRKVLDITRVTDLGWEPTIGLRDGLADLVEWYGANRSLLRA